MQSNYVIHPFMDMYTLTCPECREGSEELTEQQLFAQDLLDVFLAFHRETLQETVIKKLKISVQPTKSRNLRPHLVFDM